MRRGLAALLGVLALVAAVLAVVSPTERSREVVEWNAGGGNPLAVSLLDPRPAAIEAHGVARAGESGTLLQTFTGDPSLRVEKPSAHLVLEQRGDRIVLEFVGHEGQTVASTQLLPIDGEGWWALRWDGATASVSTGGRTESLKAPVDRIVVLNWLESSGTATSATITSSGFSLDRASPWHGLWIVLALILTLAAVVASGETRMRGRIRWRRPAWATVSGPDAFVVGVLVLGAFVLAPHYDDGWYLARSRLLAATGWSLQTPLSDPYWGGVPNIQGFLYESLLGLTFAQSTIIVVIRILPIALIIATWLVLSRAVLPRLAGGHWPRWVGAGVVALWGCAFLTLRPEVLIGLLGAVLVALFPRTRGRLVVLPVVGALGIAALGLSTHQTGLVLVPLAAVAAVLALSRPAGMAVKITAVTSGLAVAIALGFINQNAELALQDLRGYDALTAHGAGPLDEWLRVAELLRIGTFGQRAFDVVLAAGLTALVGAVIWRWSRRSGALTERLLLGAILVMPLGLLATSSKWSWHYAALIVPCVVGIVLGAAWLARRCVTGVARMATAAIVAAAALATVWFAAGSYSVPGAWLRPVLLAGLVVVAVGGIALGLRRGANGPTGMTSAVAVGLVIVVLGVSLAQGVRAARDSTTGWSWLAQTTRGIVDEAYRCGAIEVTGPVGGPGSPAGPDLVSMDAPMTVGPGQYLVNPCTPIWTRTGGLWNPIHYSIEDPNWLLANLPVREDPPRACVDRSTPDLNGNYQSCVLELIPPEVPQASGSVVSQ